MIDTEHPVVERLVTLGYRIALHVYLRNQRIKTTVAAKHPETGKLLQGWSKDGSLDGALQDLASRSDLLARPRASPVQSSIAASPRKESDGR